MSDVPGTATASRGREHPAEEGRQNLRSDGQKPRRQAHARGIPGG